MTRLERIIRRRRQLHLSPFDVYYRRPLVGALGSKLVGASPRMLNDRYSDWLPPVVSRRLGRLLLWLGNGLLVRSRPLYSHDRGTWYSSHEWSRRFEVESPEDAVATNTKVAREAEFEDVGEALARAEAAAAALGWHVSHLGRHTPDDVVTWEATARGHDAVNHHHGEGATARAALEELIDRLRLEREVQAVDAEGS